MKKFIKKIFSVGSISLLTTILWFKPASAQLSRYAGFPTDLTQLISQILTFIFGAAGAIFVIMIIMGGFQYLTSMGNEETATKAKKLMTDAVIGIVVVVAAWAISDWILKGIGGQAQF